NKMISDQSTWTRLATYLLPSFDFVWFFFRFGVGILHSMEKATQLVQGTPRLAASHRTCRRRHCSISYTADPSSSSTLPFSRSAGPVRRKGLRRLLKKW